MNGFTDVLERYLSAEDIALIGAVSVGIAGAGGLGSNCAMLLTRCGFSKFRIVDFDVIDSSNLNRQFYFQHQVGQSKVLALQDNLRMINPAVQVEAVSQKLDQTDVGTFFADSDIIVEAFDRAEYKKMLIEAYWHSDKFLVSASGLAGYGDSDRIQVHRIRPKFYLVGDRVTQAGEGCPPLAPCVMIAAAKQADLILEYVLKMRKERL